MTKKTLVKDGLTPDKRHQKKMQKVLYVETESYEKMLGKDGK
ncbi:hypothetical protein [Sphingobacterium kyonggiense]